MMQTGKDVNYQIKSIIGIQVFMGIYFQKNLICMQEIPHGIFRYLRVYIFKRI
jgi:hypothetical protein